MIRKVLVTALLSGFLAGLFVSGLQAVKVVPLIHEAETYEEAATAPPPAATGGNENAGAAHQHEPEDWQPEEGFERIAYTIAADVLAAMGFAFLLVGAYVFSGRPVDAKRGLLWGLAGYAVFSLAPSLGLPPELPGAAPETVASADLVARQIWWLGTAAATAAGLALIVFARHLVLKALGVLCLVAPHLIGAPQRLGVESVVPSALREEFILASLVTSILFWLALGAASGWLYARQRIGPASRPE